MQQMYVIKIDFHKTFKLFLKHFSVVLQETLLYTQCDFHIVFEVKAWQ